MKLKNKNIIITGGSGIIGKAIIKNMKNHGAYVINLDITNYSEDSADRFIKLNITDYDQVRKVITEVIKERKVIHGLINNAYPRTNDWGAPFKNIEYESWQQNIDWQLNSVFVISQLILEHMKLNKHGSVINIASIYGVVANDMELYKETKVSPPAAYSAIKGGLIHFTKYLASLYGRDNVRVNCISPGGIYNGQDKKFVKRYEDRVPMKRMGNAEDIAPAISFFLSEEARYITGQNLVIDGGWTII